MRQTVNAILQEFCPSIPHTVIQWRGLHVHVIKTGRRPVNPTLWWATYLSRVWCSCDRSTTSTRAYVVELLGNGAFTSLGSLTTSLLRRCKDQKHLPSWEECFNVSHDTDAWRSLRTTLCWFGGLLWRHRLAHDLIIIFVLIHGVKDARGGLINFKTATKKIR